MMIVMAMVDSIYKYSVSTTITSTERVIALQYDKELRWVVVTNYSYSTNY